MGINLLFSAKMGNGTFQAKFIPLSQIDEINALYVVRKAEGPTIPKVKYIILPKICKNPLINFVITPVYLCYYALKLKPKFLIGYHFAPHAPFVYLASLFSGVPYIFCQTGGESQTYLHKPVIKYWVRKILNKSYYINTPGYQSLDYWKSHQITAPIQVLHSTINIDVFKPDSNINKTYDLIYVGILNERKRVIWILEALVVLKSKHIILELCVVGKGDLLDELKSFCVKNGIDSHVHFVGFQTNINEWLNKSKIFVMTSVMEGLPVALMEAMATELLCVVPKVDNIPSVVDDGQTGYLFDIDDQQTFFKKLENAYLNYDDLIDIRLNARQRIINEYSYDVAIAKWKKILL